MSIDTHSDIETNEMDFPNEFDATQKAKKMLLYISIFSIFMLFAAFTSAYIVSKGDGFWVNILTMPKAFWISTIIIMLSSVTMHFAVTSSEKNNLKSLKIGTVATLILGIAFGLSQYKSWYQLHEMGNSFVGQIVNENTGELIPKGEYDVDYSISYQNRPLTHDENGFYLDSIPLSSVMVIRLNQSGNTASSYLWILTWVHLIHVLISLLFLVIINIKAFTNKYTSKTNHGLKRMGIFWHFLGILWIYILLFLLFIH